MIKQSVNPFTKEGFHPDPVTNGFFEDLDRDLEEDDYETNRINQHHKKLTGDNPVSRVLEELPDQVIREGPPETLSLAQVEQSVDGAITLNQSSAALISSINSLAQA